MLPPITMPSIRRSIKPDAVKNKGLKDILSPTAKALEVLSVEKLEYQVHNTRAVVLVEENGVVEERVLIYNRVNLRSVLSNYMGDEGGINRVIELMNEDGYDVTTDDIYLDGLTVRVTPTSLGFYEGEAEVVTCAAEHHFKYVASGELTEGAWLAIRSAIEASQENLTLPYIEDLSLFADRIDVFNSNIYQYTIVKLVLGAITNAFDFQNFTVRFDLPSAGITGSWEEITLLGEPDVPDNFNVIRTLDQPGSNSNIERCFTAQHRPS